MRNGVCFLACLDGAPLGDRDRAVLDLAVAPGSPAIEVPGAAIRAHDVDANAVHLRVESDGIDMLLGYLDEPEDLADALALDARTPPLQLACAALDRFGDAAPARMAGQWTLLRWHAAARTLVVLISETRRDTVYLATDGRRVALAPDIARLARLDWVDGALDPRGLLLALGRGPLRRGQDGGTVARGVSALLPGTRTTLRLGERRTSTAEPLIALPPRAVSFDDAMAEIEALLRRIVRLHLARQPRTALMLSGGLDSSLLAWLLGVERPAGHDLVFLTSAAPPGSGLRDEVRDARIVADHLGVPIHPVCPRPDADVYRPGPALFGAGEPTLSVRHYLYDAFFDAAAGSGARTLFDGIGGELSVTNHARFLRPSPWRDPVRHVARSARDWIGPRVRGEGWPQSAFHARLSREALASLPADLADIWGDGLGTMRRLRLGDAFGIETGAQKVATVPTATSHPTLRTASPFTDRRLLRLVGAFPASIMHHEGQARAPARALLRGRLPDAVRLSPAHLPFSPTYLTMLRDQAPAARARIDGWRAAGVDAWLDLDWLARALDRVGQGSADMGTQFQAQLTALAAEYLMWRRDPPAD